MRDDSEPQTQVADWAERAVREAAEPEEGDTGRHRPGTQHGDREQQVLDRIDRARRRKPKIKEENITLAHGSGGKATGRLIEAIFLEEFRNPLLEELEDQATFPVGAGATSGLDGARMAFTTDSFVVSPLFFPGEIGRAHV